MFAAIKHNSHTGAWARLERGELSLEEFYEPFAREVSAMRGEGDKVNITIENNRDNIQQSGLSSLFRRKLREQWWRTSSTVLSEVWVRLTRR